MAFSKLNVMLPLVVMIMILDPKVAQILEVRGDHEFRIML